MADKKYISKTNDIESNKIGKIAKDTTSANVYFYDRDIVKILKDGVELIFKRQQTSNTESEIEVDPTTGKVTLNIVGSGLNVNDGELDIVDSGIYVDNGSLVLA